MLFWRVKPLDKILETAEKKALTRQLGAFQLTMLGIGAVIGTGIFVLTAEAGQKAGPGMMIAFVIAAVVCGLAALAYSELASMVPVSGSAYTYTYGVLGELIAWIVGWALGLEYGIGAAVVTVGWSGYMNGLLANTTLFGLVQPGALALPPALQTGLFAGGSFNILAFGIALLVTWLLVIGTSKSAKVNSVLVAIKIIALTLFIVMALPVATSHTANFTPFLPGGWGSPLGGIGVLGAAASIFFAYVGFDAISTAAEETKNPNRNIPIGLIASLAVCTIFYLLVGYAAVGAVGAQPIMGPDGVPLEPGSQAFAAACKGSEALVCSHEPLAHVLRLIGWPNLGNWIGVAAILALPSVILMMMFGQTRIFFTMSRDGLLPERLSRVHPRFHTPHVITLATGLVVAFCGALFPVGKLADTSNSGTLLAFAMVSIGVLVLRKQQPDRPRPFRTPFAWVVCPLAVAGCLLLFVNLSMVAKGVFAGWAVLGLIIYTLYSRKRSHLAPGNEQH
ncbi:amino acid permease [Pseudoxanthomonas winnipegensis]|uniref:Amino acid permease n=1 Tax=Pseudoxanthomonas winnipegensis TaxID=2480810 RepID=A0A4Q8LF63_9GAMM|nr:amino acid permease [Pseudoxanthomonas winnipegensis]RZZ81849.1 amino acid permease [Pseudoxanthomonas winnipegensis]RZZ90419.1 amino acid permease [Pseudoxanthomonas winnipegensis]TAA27831.1 amino acid permease [Pseudoxanthomonas winnipegensis]TAA37424.1 amino acid permease [Pseudoxanthomonas winnipegensis]TAA42282.1 amino acid permease [Pseudoxanthomonas winnipegensis]